jgi:glycosyltransferase involved in cell wall biosynthesis
VRIAALVPAYDAESTVADVVEATRRVLPEVVVVDDGSSDHTATVARGAGAVVLRLDSNGGKGAALRAGFRHLLEGGAEAVVTLDADGQHDPGEIPRLVELWSSSGAGVVIGSQLHLRGGMLPIRRFGNRFADRAISFFAGVRVAGTQSGFRLYDARLLRSLRLTGTGYELESEIIVKAVRSGFRVLSIPVQLRWVEGSTTSHYRPWRDTARICVRVVASRLRR